MTHGVQVETGFFDFFHNFGTQHAAQAIAVVAYPLFGLLVGPDQTIRTSFPAADTPASKACPSTTRNRPDQTTRAFGQVLPMRIPVLVMVLAPGKVGECFPCPPRGPLPGGETPGARSRRSVQDEADFLQRVQMGIGRIGTRACRMVSGEQQLEVQVEVLGLSDPGTQYWYRPGTEPRGRNGIPRKCRESAGSCRVRRSGPGPDGFGSPLLAMRPHRLKRTVDLKGKPLARPGLQIHRFGVVDMFTRTDLVGIPPLILDQRMGQVDIYDIPPEGIIG